MKCPYCERDVEFKEMDDADSCVCPECEFDISRYVHERLAALEAALSTAQAQLAAAQNEREELLCGLENELGTLGAEAMTNEQVLDAVKLAKDQLEYSRDMFEAELLQKRKELDAATAELAALRWRIDGAKLIWGDGKHCWDAMCCYPSTCHDCKQYKLLPVEQEGEKQ